MIQWFPGHMAKARREIEENLKLVDVVIELVDARAPHASQNPMLQEIIQNKQKVVLLMKQDLADPVKTKKWITYFNENEITALAIHVNNKNDIAKIIEVVNNKGLEQQKRLLNKGVQQRAVRALIAGVPNVGKSTLINRLANKKIAKIGDRPGVTKKQQWIKVRQKFELLDTPGILWPKFEEQLIGMKLAAIGTIKYELVPTQDVAAFVIDFLFEHDPNQLEKRYRLTEHDDMWDTFVHIGKHRGALESGGQVNFDKVAEFILQDFRTGKLGRITLEVPE
ncbi:ribosome biogenesis GTPase YlqF [Pseudogracilibacillus auburnensis]|uniref:Ribosome biogenesis GTPase A n=1 Tax=Pseudogracilibacillus auburnensis TaxID=1494959 RepID=A0A2V3WIH0_9BACI|nr:ribosome biogenesis GTPase YlqF [Pseudogracilibacillus auburnensis]PXW88589.1 Ras superfamily GTP-binding protein YlqF [Pseudogracilibacillus auburnensis]